jgi:hypothetical protein
MGMASGICGIKLKKKKKKNITLKGQVIDWSQRKSDKPYFIQFL